MSAPAAQIGSDERASLAQLTSFQRASEAAGDHGGGIPALNAENIVADLHEGTVTTSAANDGTRVKRERMAPATHRHGPSKAFMVLLERRSITLAKAEQHEARCTDESSLELLLTRVCKWLEAYGLSLAPQGPVASTAPCGKCLRTSAKWARCAAAFKPSYHPHISSLFP